MRHRKRGRTLGRSSSHRKAMLRNLASSFFLTERDAEYEENEPKVKGRIVTTLHKAKEVRPLVEKCITIARRSLEAQQEAEPFAFDSHAGRQDEDWKAWRNSDEWQKWNRAIGPAVAARRRALKLLGSQQAVRILFEEIAPRMENRQGGYTRILRLARPRLGDGGTRAILELVGVHDRVKIKAEKPAFDKTRDEEEEWKDEPTTAEAEDAVEEPLDADESNEPGGPAR